MGQSVDSLKQKFKVLHNKRTPINNPHCPPSVGQAKHLRHQIVYKMDGTDLIAEAGDGLDNANGSNFLSADDEKRDDGNGEIAGVTRQSSFATSASAASLLPFY